ncbi:conserved Plasmodium protein, unknown function [Plasmodium chabaudi adami]|uniref:DUF4211 domain-containing protein n=1 Tax=Plasmodium chabaudi adami TaxID=5826 RepID=A0A1D3RZ44_PLACE|nr:conserved Plasmodium protein, unknown function [Plasmodium chabaudi adami]
MININYHSTKLKGDCDINSAQSKKSSSPCEEDNDKHKEKEFVDKNYNVARKKKLFALTKGLNITNVSKLNDNDLNKSVIKTKNRLKKIINTDSSSDGAYDDNIVIKENGKRRKKKKKKIDSDEDEENTEEENEVENDEERGKDNNCNVIELNDENDKEYTDLCNLDNDCDKNDKCLIKNNSYIKQTKCISIEDKKQSNKYFTDKNDQTRTNTNSCSDSSNSRMKIKEKIAYLGSPDFFLIRDGSNENINKEKLNNNPAISTIPVINLFSETESKEISTDNTKTNSSDNSDDMNRKTRNKKKKISKYNNERKKKKQTHKKKYNYDNYNTIDDSYNSQNDNFYSSDRYMNSKENSFYDDGSEYENNSNDDNHSYEYELHLKLFNEQNWNDNNFQYSSLSMKKTMKLYIEFIILSLLSPNLKYDSDYFHISENVKNAKTRLKENYANIYNKIMQKKSLQECFNNSEESEIEEDNETIKSDHAAKKKKKKSLKRLSENIIDLENSLKEDEQKEISSDDNYNEWQNVEKTDNQAKKKKKKYVLSDSDSDTARSCNVIEIVDENKAETENGDNNICEENSESVLEIEDLKKDNKNKHLLKGKTLLKDTESSKDSSCGKDSEEEENNYNFEEGESNEFDEEDLLINRSSDDDRDYIFDYKKKSEKKKITKEINDNIIHKILNDDTMINLYEYAKNDEGYSNYDFLKTLCKIRSIKDPNYYENYIKKIENKILSKRDQFESHPFDTQFKNILKNYANIFISYLEHNNAYCSCCNRKLTYACPVFFIKPFYKSSDLWKNSFYNFMKINNYEYFGQIGLTTLIDPAKISNSRSEDDTKMRKIKEANKLFIKNQNEKLLNNLLIQIDTNTTIDNKVIESHEQYIQNYLNQCEESKGYRYTGDIDEKRFQKKKDSLKMKTAYSFFTNINNNDRDSNLSFVLKNVCDNFSSASKYYIEKDIIVLHLGSFCVSTVYYWHVFHHYKFFFTKYIYMKLSNLYKKDKNLFKEPFLLAHIISKKLNKELYKDFKILMNIDISKIQQKWNERDMFVK